MLRDSQRPEGIQPSRKASNAPRVAAIFASPDEESEPPEHEMETQVTEVEAEEFSRPQKTHETTRDPFLEAHSNVEARADDQEIAIDRARARKVAQLKIGFLRTSLGLLFANLLLFAVAFFEVQPSGKLWFVWPLGLSVAVISLRYFRAYILKGRSLQGYFEAMERKLEEREYLRGIQ